MRVLAFCLLAASAYAQAPEFNRDVRPILSDKCFACHGPDAKAKNIPLRLDREDAAKADLGGRRAIIPGDAEASEVIKRITADKPFRKMPPVSTGHTISPKELEILRAWIASGAKWEKHWAFLAPKRPELPAVSNAKWPRNPIDRFILARLDKEGLAPSPEAPRETLLRRASLDLTGLPPTLAELDEYLNDKSSDAYERAVDRLLASPAYAERMAYRWLDYARYSDTNGYQFDGERSMWRWRDWVIDAFARNMPYNQFTLEQIAGDMLPGATLDQRIATGFNRNHRGNSEFGIVAEEYAVEYVIDRVETTSATFLGLTLGCARCHNHKYDPFTQKEFYQIYSYFNNVPEQGRAMKYGNSAPLVAAPTDKEKEQLRVLNGRIGRIEAEMADVTPAGYAAPAVEWAPSSGRVEEPAKFLFDIEDRFTVSTRVRAAAVPNGAIWSRMGNVPRSKGFGLYAKNGRLHAHATSEYEDDAIRMDSAAVLEANRDYTLTVTYSGSKMAEGLRVYLDGKLVPMKVSSDNLYRPLGNAGKQYKDPFRIGAGGGPKNDFNGTVENVHVYSRVLGRDEVQALAASRPLADIAAKPDAARTGGEKKLLEWYYLEHASPLRIREQWAQLTKLYREREALERTFSTVMVMAEANPPKVTHLLQRGQYDKPGEVVQGGTPGELHPLPSGSPNNRLGFAQWLVAPENPLTARVAVNRFWQMIFGAGIVNTVEDFGLQGEWPMHPELLDWLATEFQRTNWDTKAMMKLLVTSATYRQESKATPALLQRDPANRLLARSSRFRIPAETVRDQALALSGLLNAKTGGPSVKPYQPDGLWKELSMQDMDYARAYGADLYRRSLYTFWKRTVAPPMLANFDAANREACVVRESRTNTPLQALNLMNDVQFVEAARFLGQRMLLEGGAMPEERLRFGFRLVTSRAPSAEELELLRSNLAFHRDYFAGDSKRAETFLAQGDAPADGKLDKRELASYAALGSLLLNLDEAVTKE